MRISSPAIVVPFNLFVALILLAGMPVIAQQEIDFVQVVDSLITPVVAEPVTSLIATDHKYDDGEKIDLHWVPSIDAQVSGGKVLGYNVYRMENNQDFKLLAKLESGAINQYADETVHLDSSYVYYLSTVTETNEYESIKTEPISPEREWINYSKKYLFLIALLIGGAIIYYIETARRGKKLFVRKIAGLEAVDEAVGRATEMGRPILFIPGIQDLDDVQTLAALTILGRIARTVADYDTEIKMPVSRSLVMTAGRETIRAAYIEAGRPDKYHDDMVNYITDEQFGYVAAVDGIMVREKPATVFLLGAFFAESLILAETGNYIGAIQIAGTARPAQLPFFIAACDFTLIGEELFAASAYLSGEPKALGSLKGQDVGKVLAMAAIIAGVILATVFQVNQSGAIDNILSTLKEIFSIN